MIQNKRHLIEVKRVLHINDDTVGVRLWRRGTVLLGVSSNHAGAAVDIPVTVFDVQRQPEACSTGM